jgi:type IV secretion system protein VirD4
MKDKNSNKIRIAIYGTSFLLLVAIVPWLIAYVPLMGAAIKNQSMDAFGTAAHEWLERGYLTNMATVIASKQLLIGSGLVILLAMLGLMLWLGTSVLARRDVNARGANKFGPPAAGHGEFGNARWQTEKEMAQSTTVWEPDKSSRPKVGGIVLGVENTNGKEKYYLSSDDTHTLIVGTTRSGKGRRILFQSIWELAKTEESMVFTDPKGELYLSTKEYLEAQGYKVIAMNYREPEKSAYWNPMSRVIDYVKAEDMSNAEQAARDIADGLVDSNQSHTGDRFWNDTAKSVITALIMMLAVEADDDLQKHLYGVSTLLGKYGRPDDFDRVPLQMLIDKLPLEHPSQRAFYTVGIASEKTRASIYASALTAIQLFADRKIGSITSKTDHDFKDVARKKTAVFLVIPDERSTYNVLATIYINQLYQALIELANESGGRLERRVNFILDEFGNLPAIPQFDSKMTVAGGRGMRFTVVVQAIQQLEKLYDKASDTIKGNCHTWMYLLTAEMKTAEEIEKRLGKYTISTTSSGMSAQYGGAAFRPSSTSNTSLTGRSLVMATDLTQWKAEDGSIILRVREFPARFPTPDLSELRANKDLGLGNKEETAKTILQRDNALPLKKITTPKVWLPELGKFKTKYKLDEYEDETLETAPVEPVGKEVVREEQENPQEPFMTETDSAAQADEMAAEAAEQEAKKIAAENDVLKKKSTRIFGVG